MMFYNGGLIVRKALSQIVGFPEKEAERAVKELETTSSYGQRVVRSQVYGSNFDKFKAEPASKPTGLRTNPVTFKDKPLGSEKVRYKAPEPSSKERKDETLQINKGVHNSDSGSKKEFQQSLGSRQWLDEQHSTGRSPFPKLESDDEDWRSLSRALATGQKVSTISNHELMRIAELRFSTDMNEGDSGNHVVLLQKALFWLGYLSKRSDITGFFGTETKKALCEFQEAHGVNQTGAWGSVSKQALWHTISAEILHRVVDEKANKPAEAFINGKSDAARRVWESWAPLNLADFFTAARPEGDWRLLSGIALLMVGILIGLFISKVSSRSAKDISVKRRIVRSTESEDSFSPLKNEKLSVVTSSSNGAAVVDKISQFQSKEPSHIAKVEAVGQADAAHAPQKKVIPSSMYVSSLGHGVQHNTGKKAVHGTGIPSQRANSSKPDMESMRRGKQPGSWSNRPTRGLENYSKVSENSRPESLSSGRQETARLQREPSKPIKSPLSISKNALVSREDELSSLKKLDNEFSYPKSDGLVTMHGEDEPNVRKRIEELRKTIEAAEQNGQAAVDALAEERKRSLELEEKISRQRETAAALEEEVRVLKESHDALLESLRKKTGSANRGASLLYRNFKGDGND